MNSPINGKPGLVKEVTSTANPIIKEIKSLALKKNRDERGLFMAEGLKLVVDAVENDWEVDTVIYSNQMAKNELLQQVAAKARASGANILIVSEKVLSAISRKDNPQMVMGVFHQRWFTKDSFIELARNPGETVLALDRIRDPGNLGTILRTADCAGVRGVILVGETTDPYSLESVRATMGSIFEVPLLRMSEDEFIDWRDSFKGRVVGTHLKGAIDYRTVNWTDGPALVLMGNEQQGLTDALARCCDDVVIIPMAGKADSLNLAIATGIILFEARREALIYRPAEGQPI